MHFLDEIASSSTYPCQSVQLVNELEMGSEKAFPTAELTSFIRKQYIEGILRIEFIEGCEFLTSQICRQKTLKKAVVAPVIVCRRRWWRQNLADQFWDLDNAMTCH